MIAVTYFTAYWAEKNQLKNMSILGQEIDPTLEKAV